MESKPKMSAGSEVLLTLACLNSAQLSLRWKTQQKMDTASPPQTCVYLDVHSFLSTFFVYSHVCFEVFFMYPHITTCVRSHSCVFSHVT